MSDVNLQNYFFQSARANKPDQADQANEKPISRVSVRTPIKRSNVALDALNVCLADMRDGLGPYLALFLIGKNGWSPSRIGWALAAASMATLLSTAPAGMLFDNSRRKRGLIVGASSAIAIFTCLLSAFPSFWAVMGLQISTGFASAFIGPGIACLSLGIVGQAKLSRRIGRNETFNHGGNLLAAMIAAALVSRFSVVAVFYLVVMMSVFSAFSVLCIPREEINDLQARGLSERGKSRQPTPFKELFRNRDLLLFLFIAAAFQFSNASLLPIAVQSISRISAKDGARFLSYGIVVAQLIAVPAAWFAGSFSKRVSPSTCLAIGMAAVIGRALIFASVQNVDILILTQVLDGVAAGIIAVAPLIAVCKLTNGSGHFTFAAGILATAIGVGASASQILCGYIAEFYGVQVCFLTMAALASLALVGMLSKQISGASTAAKNVVVLPSAIGVFRPANTERAAWQ